MVMTKILALLLALVLCGPVAVAQADENEPLPYGCYDHQKLCVYEATPAEEAEEEWEDCTEAEAEVDPTCEAYGPEEVADVPPPTPAVPVATPAAAPPSSPPQIHIGRAYRAHHHPHPKHHHKRHHRSHKHR
jgi:hypothetical protein